jgi:hypothetical protein
MSDNCQMVVFSNKAYNAIIRESFAKDPVETGGILLGHILDNGIWIVMEVLPPGIHCIFERAYFEYDDAFVNYLAQSVANQYKEPLDLLGLWHRHPGSMDYFSSTDDGTNITFSKLNSKGVISGLVNIDPQFRLGIYHMPKLKSSLGNNRPPYEKVSVEVGDDIIPEEYFELRYYDGEDSNLHPCVSRQNNKMRNVSSRGADNGPKQEQEVAEMSLDIESIIRDNSGESQENPKFIRQTTFIDEVIDVLNILKKKWRATLLIVLASIVFGFTIKSIYTTFKQTIDWVGDLNPKSNDDTTIERSINIKLKDQKDSLEELNCENKILKDVKWINKINISVGEKRKIETNPQIDTLKWESRQKQFFNIIDGNVVNALQKGEGVAVAKFEGTEISCKVIITDSVRKPSSNNLFKTKKGGFLFPNILIFR